MTASDPQKRCTNSLAKTYLIGGILEEQCIRSYYGPTDPQRSRGFLLGLLLFRAEQSCAQLVCQQGQIIM